MPPWPWSCRPEPEPLLMQDLTLRRILKEADRLQKRAEYETERLRKQLRSQWDDWISRPTSREQLAVQAFIAGGVISTASLIAMAFVSVRYFHRVPNAEWVTPDMLGGSRWLKGYVTRVGDSDNFRLYHTHSFGWKWLRTIPEKRSRDLADRHS
ncbi:hypothetical protein C8T65DRAFT_832924 [Cerioporus squamosus]|nr:hypothetical protein C8T65DRAFT_832924 [Cerioporus squamosus]